MGRVDGVGDCMQVSSLVVGGKHDVSPSRSVWQQQFSTPFLPWPSALHLTALLGEGFSCIEEVMEEGDDEWWDGERNK